MNRSLAALLIGLATPLAFTAPVTAQEWQVAREQFAFAGSRLDIRVDVEAPGRLRLLRGEPGNVRVAGRAVSGFTAAGLTHDEQLTLTAMGDGPVEYLVSVPEGVWISVRLPDRPLGESVAGHASGRTFEWDGTAVSPRAGDAGPTAAPPLWTPPPTDASFDAPLFTTFARDDAPAEVALPDLRYVRGVTVRVEGYRFRIATSRPLSLERGDPHRIEIRPAAPPLDVVIVLPVGTPAFSLRAGGSIALLVSGDDLTTFCSPVTRQWLSDGRRWVTFTPVDGSLQCAPVAARRHEG